MTGAGGGTRGPDGRSARGASGRGQRDLRVRVKTAKGRKLSSTLWLERQLNDPYVARARREGYRGRAAFKIIELDDRFGFLKPGARVVDLGCAPGGWCQVAVARVNALGEKTGKPAGMVLGVDLQEVAPLAGAEIHQLDFLADGADEQVQHDLLLARQHVPDVFDVDVDEGFGRGEHEPDRACYDQRQQTGDDEAA